MFVSAARWSSSGEMYLLSYHLRAARDMIPPTNGLLVMRFGFSVKYFLKTKISHHSGRRRAVQEGEATRSCSLEFYRPDPQMGRYYQSLGTSVGRWGPRWGYPSGSSKT